MPDLVKLTVDDREVQVPAGTGLVETAAAAGIEIPVFCYEPRLGAPGGRVPHVPRRDRGHPASHRPAARSRRRTAWS